MGRYPLSNNMCHAAAVISPERMIMSKKNSEINFSAICDTLSVSHYLSSEGTGKAKEQYLKFMDTVVLPNRETSLTFNIEKERLNTFLYMESKNFLLCEIWWYSFSLCFTDRGTLSEASISTLQKEKNLKKESLVAQRIIYDIVLTDKLCSLSWHLLENESKSLLKNKTKSYLKRKKKERKTYRRDWKSFTTSRSSESNDKWAGRGSQVAECYNETEDTGVDLQTIVAKRNVLRRAATDKRKLMHEQRIAVKNWKKNEKGFELVQWDQRSKDTFLRCFSRYDCQKLCCYFFPVWTFSVWSLFFNIVSFIPKCFFTWHRIYNFGGRLSVKQAMSLLL